MKRGKRGISGVVTAILLILLAIAAVIIVWSVIKPLISNKGTDTDVLSVNLKVEKAEVVTNPDDGSSQFLVRIKREPGAGNVASFKIVLSNSTDEQLLNSGVGLNELESDEFNFVLGVTNPTKVDVYPVLIKDGQEVIGIKEEASVSGSGVAIECNSPSDCGSNLCRIYDCTNNKCSNTAKCSAPLYCNPGDGSCNVCLSGQTQLCSEQQGVCSGSQETCTNYAWLPGGCTSANYLANDAAYEANEVSCDGKDNDCDGTIDEGCSCTNGQTRACYTGPTGTQGVGECHKGTQTCSGGTWGSCVGEVIPITENIASGNCADLLDNDCDNLVDTDPDCSAGTGLVAYYSFDNSDANDGIGTNNGVNHGATFVSGGHSGQAASFDGTGNYIEIPGSVDFNFNTQFSISVWVNPNVLTGGKYIISKVDGAGAAQDFQIRTIAGNLFKFAVQDTTGWISVDTTAFSTGSWYNLVAVKDGPEIRIYKNGVLDSSIAIGDVIYDTYPIRIGTRRSDVAITDFFNGKIDELKIYNKALSQTEINALYNS